MRVLVLADSLSYFGPHEAMPADDPRLWPNLLDARAHVFAGPGWTMRDAYWSLSGDPAVWALLPRVDAVVLATGGMDMLPSPLPTYLREGIRYIRQDRVRRVVRSAYLAAQPVLSRVPGCPVALPPAASAGYARKIVTGLRSLRPELPVLGTLPPLHRSPAHGASLVGCRPQRTALTGAYAALAVPVVDLCGPTAEHVLGGHGNPDGMHWGWEGHAAVAAAVGARLDALLAR